MKHKLLMLAFAVSAVLPLGAVTTSYLYVVSAGDRVRRFAVDEQGTITLDKADFITCNSGENTVTRPVKIVRIGRIFYVLDQYADSNLGYFSIAKYDLCGNFLGKLVHRGANIIGGTLGKADGMAASPDGKWLYVNDYNLGAIFRVSVADGSFTTFATGMSQNRDIHVTSDGKVYATARANKKVWVFNPDGTAASPASYSFGNQVGGVYVDEAKGKLYGRYAGSMQVHNLGTDKVVETVSMPGQGLAIEKVGEKLVSGNWTIWDPKSILFTCDPENSYAITQIASGLGNVQDVYLDPNGLDEPMYPDAAHTSLAMMGNDLFFAADNGVSAVGSDAQSTIWKSTDKGATWATLATLPAANPTFVEMTDGKLMLLTEPRRANGDKQFFAVGDFAADGAVSPAFAATNKTDLTFVPANGRMRLAKWGFAGWRAGIGLRVEGATNTMAAFTFVSERASAAFPDPVFTVNVTTNASPSGNSIRRTWTDVLPPVIFAGPKDGEAHYHQELVPTLQARTTVATRPNSEFVLKTEHLNGVNYSPKWAPTVQDRIMLPGGGKAFDIAYDEMSGLYWAVSTPVTNAEDLATYDPGAIRNVLALYASDDLAQWRLCRILRTEGTPETVAFSKPQLQVVGDDLLVTYTATGASATGHTLLAAGAPFFCDRVTNFRTTWPGALETTEGLLITDFNQGLLKMLRRDPLTGAWMSRTLIGKGPYGAEKRTLTYLSGIAVVRTRIYVTCETQGILVFDLKGRYRGFIGLPNGVTKCDTVCAGADGASLLVSDSSYNKGSIAHHAVRRYDLETKAWTTLTTGSVNTGLNAPRGLCAKKDGSFFVACREGSKVFHYAADGQTYTTIGTFTGALSVALNEDETHLFVGTRWGWVIKVNLSDNSTVTLLAPVTNIEGAAHSIVLRDGRLIVSDYGAGTVYSLDPDTPFQTPRMEAAGFDSAGRLAPVDLSLKDGCLIIVK